jgi:hypothetical protein
MAKLPFEMPVLLDLNGLTFDSVAMGLLFEGPSCHPGCADGCSSGCDHGSGTGVKPTDPNG